MPARRPLPHEQNRRALSSSWKRRDGSPNYPRMIPLASPSCELVITADLSDDAFSDLQNAARTKYAHTGELIDEDLYFGLYFGFGILERFDRFYTGNSCAPSYASLDLLATC
ncbi:hypothetical protein PAHAL_5G094800 [Panicum hallii]|uniref:Uncharacterized protein n=1 Tax=Panicum hallii TaxID=206008 RepID=A0A2T8IJH8_9POAL|nr:hypothetical protein PAHAL_5G094800 [Panicum hallii]